MFPQQKQSVTVDIQVDDAYWKEYADAYLKELFDHYLQPQFLTIADMEKITRRKRAWIMEYIVDDPYVRKNKLAKKDTDGKWIFDAENIRPFLKRLFDDLPDY